MKRIVLLCAVLCLTWNVFAQKAYQLLSPNGEIKVSVTLSDKIKHRVPAISEMKKPWLKGILAACKINESYYKSHYNDVDERSGSEANKEFYRTVKSILGR